VKLEAAANETYEWYCEARQWLEKLEALRDRLDHFGGPCLPFSRSQLSAGICIDPTRNLFYIESEVKRLKYAPSPHPSKIPGSMPVSPRLSGRRRPA